MSHRSNGNSPIFMKGHADSSRYEDIKAATKGAKVAKLSNTGQFDLFRALFFVN